MNEKDKYRLLSPGEKTQAGDERLRDGKWVYSLDRPGTVIGSTTQIRRKVNTHEDETTFPVIVNADHLEQLIAFVENEDLQNQIDDNPDLRQCVDELSRTLNVFAENNPNFDNR